MTTDIRAPRAGTFQAGTLFEQVPAMAGMDPADPYPAYEAIFGDPFIIESGDVAIVTRYSQCYELLRSPKVSNKRQDAPAFGGFSSPFLEHMDPPEHTRIRSVVNTALTRRSVEKLSPWLEGEVHRMIDVATDDSGEFDVLSRLAYPLPLNAVCQMLEVPMADRDQIVGWSHPITFGFDLLSGRMSRDEQKALRSAVRDFRRYIYALTAERRQAPGDDLLTRLIQAQETGAPLTDKEVTWTAMALLITGHETTVSLIGHGAIALTQHPELAERVANDPEFTESFIEELLRYDSPVQAMFRIAAEDLAVGDLIVPKGTTLLLMLGAANRDPDQFEDPTSFNVDRPNNRTHVSFGGGPHYCPGASLGRLEARLALAALAKRLVNPHVKDDGVVYRKGGMMRTQDELVLSVDGVRSR